MREVQSESIATLIGALVKAQAKIGHAIKDASNQHFRNQYATLESVIDATKGPLSEQGLVVLQQPDSDDSGRAILITTLAHVSGEWMRSFTPILTDKQTAQGLGSGLTYSRRYAIAALCNIAQADDDGNEASGKTQSTPPAKQAAMTGSAKKSEALIGGDFIIEGGKYRGKSIKQAIDLDGQAAVQNYANWLKDDSAKNGKGLSAGASAFIVNLNRFLDEQKVAREHGASWHAEEEFA